MPMDKRYEHTLHEPEARKAWEEHKTYSPENNPGQVYSVDTPPPTVSGSLHIGHIFSYTQTDIMARYKRMNGFSVYYPFGFDDNGLATERYVEKKTKVRAHQLPRSEFIALCLKETKEAEQLFKDLWQRMGLSVDWRYWYATISDESRKLSQASFIDLFKKGYVYRTHDPALYCSTCRTSIAQADLDDLEMASTFNDIIFKDQEGNDLLIGTTRPELLPSCVAVFYHPADLRYQHLKGTKATVPLFNIEVPIIADDLVDPQKGTGLVMCCTFGDKTDIEWYKKHKLPYKQSIGFDGKWLEQTGILAGLKADDARKRVLEALREQNLVLRDRPITHAVGVHERCKKEIEYVVLPQWFINILDYKKEFLTLADRINWYPHFMKSRYVNWVENLNWDWCISRQRFYGIPFPVWFCNGCDEVLLAENKDLPIDPQEISFPGGICTKCGCADIRPDTDVMDTWNTSSITPYIVTALREKDAEFFVPDGTPFSPMSMRPQAHDIIRTWAFYTVVKTWMHDKTVPWQDIVISGHVLSDQKEKLSKSKDNSATTPQALLDRFPADALRYWTASGNLGHDVAFSEQQIKQGVRLVTKLWNAFRFAQPHIEQLTDPNALPESFGTVNEWLLHEVSVLFARYRDYLESYEFGPALDALEHFFWKDFCDNYLELIKNQLFNPQEYDPNEIKATQWTLYHVGLRILQLYAPYLPFVTEAIYKELYTKTQNAQSLHQMRFANEQQAYDFGQSAEVMHHVIDAVGRVRKLKSDNQLALNAALEELLICTSNDVIAQALNAQEKLLKGVTHAQKVHAKHAQCDEALEKIGDALHAKVTIGGPAVELL